MNLDPTQLPLRDIHLPEPVSWWPPSPGWWMLAALLAVLVGICFALKSMRHRGRIRRAAQRELEEIRSRYKTHQDRPKAIAELSRLLRRVCISYAPRQQAASLVGQSWLRHLDGLSGGSRFCSGPGQVFASAPYRQDTDVDAVELFDLCQNWLKDLPAKGKKAHRALKNPKVLRRQRNQ